MARLKSLILLSMVLGAAPAQAADLLPPPPAIDGYGQVVELGTGWYLRGDIGYTHYTDPRDRFLVGERLDDTVTVGGGIGYKVNEWFRTDFTIDYRAFAGFEGVRALPFPTIPPGFIHDRAELDSLSFMFNGYVDLGTWDGFTPYVGAGIGLASHRLNDFARQVFVGNVQTGIGAVDSTFDTKNLTWALMAGTSKYVGAGLSLDLGYRYLYLGEVRTRLDADPAIRTDALQAHEVRIGARYMID